jgi:DNA (cytosine-5)-methyltransferase 1
MPTIKYYLRLLDKTFEFIENYVNLIEADKSLKFEHKERWNNLISEMK